MHFRFTFLKFFLHFLTFGFGWAPEAPSHAASPQVTATLTVALESLSGEYMKLSSCIPVALGLSTALRPYLRRLCFFLRHLPLALLKPFLHFFEVA